MLWIKPTRTNELNSILQLFTLDPTRFNDQNTIFGGIMFKNTKNRFENTFKKVNTAHFKLSTETYLATHLYDNVCWNADDPCNFESNIHGSRGRKQFVYPYVQLVLSLLWSKNVQNSNDKMSNCTQLRLLNQICTYLKTYVLEYPTQNLPIIKVISENCRNLYLWAEGCTVNRPFRAMWQKAIK